MNPQPLAALASAAVAIGLVPAPPPATPTSTNWAGYVTSGPASQASAVITVPRVLSPSGSADEWVGIGGWDSPALVQAGVQEISMGQQALVEPWWEMIPQPQQFATGIMVRSGNKVLVSIVEARANLWRISMRDLTDGDAFAVAVRYRVVDPTADFVLERPSDPNGSLAAFAVTSPVRFAQMRVNGGQASLAALTPIELQSSMGDIVPSSIGAGSFELP